MTGMAERSEVFLRRGVFMKKFSGLDSYKVTKELEDKTISRVLDETEAEAQAKRISAEKRKKTARTMGIISAAACLLLAVSVTAVTGIGSLYSFAPMHSLASKSTGGEMDADVPVAPKDIYWEKGEGKLDEYDLFSPEEAEFDMDGEKPSVDTGGAETDDDRYSTLNLNPEPGMLTAKCYTDNDDFAFWRKLTDTDGPFYEYAQRWNMRIPQDGRYVVKVTNNSQSALAGARAVLRDSGGTAIWSAVTNNKGVAYLFVMRDDVSGTTPKPAFIEVSRGPDSATVEITADSDTYSVLLSADGPEKSLELMLVCDTTGSMGDELEFLKTEFADIIKTVKAGNSDLPVRVSVNFYRDEGDDYVVLPFPFTEDTDEAATILSQQRADGGGDFEEAVEQALDDAINNHDWNPDAYAKLLILVLDAPPHDFAAAKMRELAGQAAGQGIRIISLVASGIDKNTEFLMRTMDIATGGTYVALTDDSGIGMPHLEPTIPSVEVMKLNELLVKVIESYLA